MELFIPIYHNNEMCTCNQTQSVSENAFMTMEDLEEFVKMRGYVKDDSGGYVNMKENVF